MTKWDLYRKQYNAFVEKQMATITKRAAEGATLPGYNPQEWFSKYFDQTKRISKQDLADVRRRFSQTVLKPRYVTAESQAKKTQEAAEKKLRAEQVRQERSDRMKALNAQRLQQPQTKQSKHGDFDAVLNAAGIPTDYMLELQMIRYITAADMERRVTNGRVVSDPIVDKLRTAATMFLEWFRMMIDEEKQAVQDKIEANFELNNVITGADKVLDMYYVVADENKKWRGQLIRILRMVSRGVEGAEDAIEQFENPIDGEDYDEDFFA